MENESIFSLISDKRSGKFSFNIRLFQSHLQTVVFGRYCLYLQSIPSTMDHLAVEIGLGSPSGTVVLAERQTKGKGQKRGDKGSENRVWVSEMKGNLYFSFLIRSQLKHLSKLLMSVPISIVQTLRQAGIEAMVKWPNDVLCKNGKKICGILVESTSEGERIDLNVGIGLNVWEDMNQNEGLKDIATSVVNEGGDVSREKLLADFFTLFEFNVLKNMKDVKEKYEELSVFKKGMEVVVMPMKKEVKDVFYKAKFDGFKKNGNMRVVKPDGKVVVLKFGEVSIKIDDMKRQDKVTT